MKNNGNSGPRPAKVSKLTKKQQLCIQCRKCCQKVGVYTDPAIYEMTEADVIHFYKARGATVNKSDDQLFIVFDTPCPHLTPTGCAIYEKRPKICRTYSGLDEFKDECLWSSLSKNKVRGTKK
jgi:Fe-S-cluster containining protein